MIYDTNVLNLRHRTESIMSLIESFERIDRNFIRPSFEAVPLRETMDYGHSYFLRYKDIVNLCEEYDCSTQKCIDEVTRVHRLRPMDVIVSLEEWRIYDNPQVLYEFSNEYVVVPEYDTPTYRLCEACMELYLETGNPSYVDFYIQCPSSILYENYFSEGAGAADAVYSGVMADDDSQEVKNAISKDEQKRAEQRARAAKRLEAKRADASRAEKLALLKRYRKHVERNAQSAAAPTSTATANNGEEGQSWLSKKWAAFKNWWNNAGTQPEGQGGWFSNLIGSIKRGLGIGQNPNKAAATAATTNSAPATPAPNETPEQKEQRKEQERQANEQKKQEQKANTAPPTSGTPAPNPSTGTPTA